MPTVTAAEQVLLHVSTAKKTVLAAYSSTSGKHPFPVAPLIQQAISDRLMLAGDHLRTGGQLLLENYYRAAISRHYYAMYHAARAVVFAENQGDDFERHNILPRNLPGSMKDVAVRESELVDARLMRNQADYDAYPISSGSWEADARALAVTAAAFVQTCEDFALTNGYI